MQSPWSVVDLILSLSLLGIGMHLVLHPHLFDLYTLKNGGSVYGSTFGFLSSERPTALWFLSIGSIGLATTCWCHRPHFWFRWIGRLTLVIGALSMLLHNISHSPPLLSTPTYLWLTLFAITGLFRTRPRNGR
jgi:lipoprotein signal peptidase